MIAFRKGDSLKTYSNFGYPLSSFEGLYLALSLSSSWFPPSNNRPPCWIRGYIPLLSTHLPTGFKNVGLAGGENFPPVTVEPGSPTSFCSPFPPKRTLGIFWSRTMCWALVLCASSSPAVGGMKDGLFWEGGPPGCKCHTVDGQNPAPPGMYKTL